MNLEKILQKHNFPQEAIDIYTKSGIRYFHPPQEDAVNKGFLDGKNLVLAVPTAAGKTLIAELGMLNAIFHRKGKCLYIAPLKALASEKYNDFKAKFEPLGIKVGLAIGDLDSPSQYLNRYQIIIATAEKVDSLLRSKAQWLIGSLSVIVLDEIHFINDESRGPTMEILTARMKQLNKDLQFLALSATIANADEIAGWLNAELVFSTWRPIPLREGVYYNQRIMFEDSGVRPIREDAPDDVGMLALDTLRDGGQALVFVNSRRSAQASARNIGKAVAKTLDADVKIQLEVIADAIAGRSDATKVCRALADSVRNGVAFHHAGLKPKQREVVEDSFKKNLVKVICSTPTLAAGVNLPARRAIIRDCKRFASGMGSVYIPASEYKQCAGRAGRPQYDEYGEAILMAKSLSESNALFDKYILAGPDPVTSKLANESTLRKHVLSSIAAGYIHDINGMFEFMEHTFLSYQKLTDNLLELIGDIFEFLGTHGFIDKSGFRYFATPLGALTSRLYIDPISSLTIREGLAKINRGDSFSNLGLLQLVATCPDSELPNLSKKDYDELEEFAAKASDELFIHGDELPGMEDAYVYYAALKSVWMLSRWIEEEKEDTICDHFNVGPGDLYRYAESAQWLLYATGVIAEMLQMKKLTFIIENLRRRIRYGIREELLNLCQLNGVGRVRARILHKKGFTQPPDFKYTTVEELGAIKGIGKVLAEEIIRQVNDNTLRRKAKSYL